jgi:hypothetical protein
MTEPARVGEVLPGVLAEAIARAGPGYDRWAEQVSATGYCAHPVRLRGRVDHTDPAAGEVRHVYSTDREPDATLLKACSKRRVGLPLLLGDLPGRQLPAPGRWPARRQGHPQASRQASPAVRDLHRPPLRPGPYPPGAGAAGIPLPPLPAWPALPAWPPDGLLAAPR